MSSGRIESGRTRLSIGARLTIWGSIITSATSLLICAGLYFGLTWSLHHEVDGFLEGELMEFLTILVHDEKKGTGAIESEIRRELGSRTRRDLAFRLLDENGKLLLTSDPQDRLPNPWIPWRMSEGGAAGDHAPKTVPAPSKLAINFASVEIPGGCAVRVCSCWVEFPRGTRRIAQATYLLDRVYASLKTFRWVCFAMFAVSVLLATIGGRILARRSLKPVGVMTETARQIGVARLSARLERSNNGDELDRLAATLNEMLDRIENQVNQMRQFTADASHELRTPLAALRGAAEVTLSQPRSPDELRQALEESIEHYDRLGRITEDLLLLARADSAQLSLHLERLSLPTIAADVVDLYAAVACEHGIRLTLAGGTDVEVDADSMRLRQLIGNLVDNAIKYIGSGRNIIVSLCQRDGQAEMDIQDDGIGIAPEHLGKVFDRFYRVDVSRSEDPVRGIGLGLSICRTIAEAHGGTISLDSTPGMGTRVIVRLPRRSLTEAG